MRFSTLKTFASRRRSAPAWRQRPPSISDARHTLTHKERTENAYTEHKRKEKKYKLMVESTRNICCWEEEEEEVFIGPVMHADRSATAIMTRVLRKHPELALLVKAV